MKIENLDEVLAKVPEEKRGEMRQEIEALFANANEDDLPGEELEELAPGTTNCPKCGGKLEVVLRNRQYLDMPPIDILACEPCDEDFVTQAAV